MLITLSSHTGRTKRDLMVMQSEEGKGTTKQSRSGQAREQMEESWEQQFKFSGGSVSRHNVLPASGVC